MRDVFATAGERSILLITHRSEGLDLVDEVVELVGGERWRLPVSRLTRAMTDRIAA